MSGMINNWMKYIRHFADLQADPALTAMIENGKRLRTSGAVRMWGCWGAQRPFLPSTSGTLAEMLGVKSVSTGVYCPKRHEIRTEERRGAFPVLWEESKLLLHA